MIVATPEPSQPMREIPIDDGGLLVTEVAVDVLDSTWFERAAAAATDGPRGGRGAARFVETPIGRVLYRPYLRGGLMARVNRDRHFWQGQERTRCFRELRLLDALRSLGLPVPEPLAALYRRRGLYYRAAIVVRAIDGAETLAERIARAPGSIDWSAVGVVLARFHAAGVDHADLNAHNLLFDPHGAVWVVDFDRGQRRAPGPWADANLARLKRSLDKLGAGLRVGDFETRAWPALIESWRRGLTP